MSDPAGQRAERLDARIDRLEDSINHFYKVINELRERLSTMERELTEVATKYSARRTNREDHRKRAR
jgi:prefoldin subunit 5